LTVDIHSDEMLAVVEKSATVEQLATGFVFTEGPVWHPYDNYLVFSDIAGNRMVRWDANDGAQTFREPSNMANGNAYDHQGRLLTCEHATSRLVRTNSDGATEVLASHYEGRELNSPNDVVVKSDGAIYFTDPMSGRLEFWGIPRDPDLPFRGVYRLEEDGTLKLLVDDFVIPNGLCFSLDESRLYVNDTKLRHIRVFDVADDGSISGGEVWVEIGGVEGERPPDGMKLDSSGVLFCTGPGGIHVFNGRAERIGVILFPENVTNFAWGGQDLRTLFVTASTSLYRIQLKQSGLKAF